MLTLFRCSSLMVAAWLGLLTVSPAHAASSTDQARDKIDDMADTVLAELYKSKPLVKDQIKKAAGYAVFSNVGINLVLASFAGGHGVVIDRQGHRTYMKMGSAGLGLGLGVKDFRAVFVFRDAAKLKAFVESGWDFSGQADAAAKSDDKGASGALAATVLKDVEVYQITKNGLALQATLQGTKYWKDKNLN